MKASCHIGTNYGESVRAGSRFQFKTIVRDLNSIMKAHFIRFLNLINIHGACLRSFYRNSLLCRKRALGFGFFVKSMQPVPSLTYVAVKEAEAQFFISFSISGYGTPHTHTHRSCYIDILCMEWKDGGNLQHTPFHQHSLAHNNTLIFSAKSNRHEFSINLNNLTKTHCQHLHPN